MDLLGLRHRRAPAGRLLTGPAWRALGPPTPPENHSRLPLLLAPLGPVVVFLNFGAVAALLLSTAVFLAAQAALLSPGFRLGLSRSTQMLRNVVGRIASAILLGAIYWLAIVPLSLTRRLILGIHTDVDAAAGWIVRARSPRTKRTYSSERDHKHGRQHPTRARTASHSTSLSWMPVRAPSVWMRTLAVGIILGLLAPRGVSLLQDSATSSLAAGSTYDPFGSPALANQPQRDAAAREFGEAFERLTPTPFVGYSLPDYQGSVVNIENRMRRSYQPAIDSGDEALDIWFFGGSVLFGFAMQRDLHTIPSEFARFAERDGIPVRVRNYASIGYVNYQETLLLAMLLEIEEPPDLVVFYDGYNDKGVQISSTFNLLGRPGEPTHTFFEAFSSAITEQTDVDDVSPGNLRTTALPPVAPGREAETAVSNLLSVYDQGIGLSEKLADAYGFDVAHFWHPDIYTKRLHPEELGIIEGVGLTQFRLDVWRDLSEDIGRALPPQAIDVSHELDAVDGPVLSTFTHINERGARHMAEVLYTSLRPTLVA